ncbi:MAG: PilZ domain-containing protein [Thiotrichales bacterium]|nr:PilZ domain-containing protein [Thiotrichales bacterium]
MPGTHSDNDHSFIDALPFGYKKVAHEIIRNDTLATMLGYLKEQNFSGFKGVEQYETLEVATIQKTICACIVAKITSFSKGLCVNDKQMHFLEETLIDALMVLLETHNKDRHFLNALLRSEHPKTLHWIERDLVAEAKSSVLEIRLRRNNNRRYFRYSGNLTYHFVRLGSHEVVDKIPGDIYSSGIKHFNEVMDKKLATIAAHYSANITFALQESHPEAHQLFMEVLQKLQSLKRILNGISLGVLNIHSALKALEENIQNPLNYESLNGNLRTEQILKDFEEKLNQLNKSTKTLLEKSTPHKLYSGPVLSKLKIDYDIKGYIEKNKKTASKLLQAFIDLYHYILLMEKVYNNISSSRYVIIFPEYWSDDFKDISPGGFAFYTEFLVDKNDILELYFHIDVSKTDQPNYEIIQQKAKVVRVEAHAELEKYLIACEFIMCPPKTIALISNAIQGQEVKDAFIALSD